MNASAERQKRRDAQYAAAWDKLSPALKARFAKAGIHGAELPRYDTGKHEVDVLESAGALDDLGGDEAEALTSQTPKCKRFVSREQAEQMALDAVRRVIANLASEPDVKLAIDCLMLVTEVGYVGETETDIAKRHRISRSAVSKRCVELCERMGIKPSRAMRSLTTRQNYATAQNKRLH